MVNAPTPLQKNTRFLGSSAHSFTAASKSQCRPPQIPSIVLGPAFGAFGAFVDNWLVVST